MKEMVKHAMSTAGIMSVFAIVGTIVLASTFFTTRAPIAESERQAKLELFRQVLPSTLHDNDLLKDAVAIAPGGELGNRGETRAYRARLNGQPSAIILESTAPDGYSGDIKLLIGLRVDGSITGVRVLAHKETPGLGDYIETTHGNWILNFDGQSLAKTAEAGWKVKKDGGSFDYMAGATITPRAVVKAVHKTLQYWQAHRDELFAAPAVKE
jgi:electron transport complex protein RnfG